MRNRVAGLSVALSAMLATAACATALAASAGATSSVSLTKDVTVAAPPSGSFAGAGSGDGWDVLFYQDRAFNVFHHDWQFHIDCHLQSDGSHCDTVDGVSPWPKTVSSSDPVSGFTTPAHASGWVDSDTGRLYGWTSRTSDGTGGVVCADLTTSASNPYCGFTPLTDPGANPESDTTAMGSRAVVNGEMFAYDASIQKIVCFSTVTDQACAGQPYDLALGGIDPMTAGWSDNSTISTGEEVFVHVNDNSGTGGVITCFDPQAKAACAGSWPQLVTTGYPSLAGNWNVGAPFPYLSTTGSVIGVCLPYSGVIPCWELTGALMTTPNSLVSAVVGSDMWNDGTTYGTRVFVPTGEVGGPRADAVSCYDFATDAACPNFPIQTDGQTYLYTVTPDPIRSGCMWINADSSDSTYSQIRTFDAYDGSSGCTDRVHVTSSVVIPDTACTALGWTSIQVLDPTRSAYPSATISLAGADGAAVANGSNLGVDANGAVDLTGLTIPDLMVFTVNFTTPTFSGNGVIIRFTWTSPNSGTCTDNATRVPDAPAIVAVTPDSNSAGLSVTFTPPGSPGTSPITTYRYSTDGGVTWHERADGGGPAGPVRITHLSSDGTALTDGTNYPIVIRAVNGAGTGLPSNTVSAQAVVSELLSAATSVSASTGTTNDVAPVYIAGFAGGVTVNVSTTIGTISVVPNGGLSTTCNPCSGAAVSFSGSQNAVNVALATLAEIAPGAAGTGTISVTVTRDGDTSPSQSAQIAVTVSVPRLATPTAPTIDAVSTSIIALSFVSVAHATSFTARVYASNGVTLVGVPHANFVAGDLVNGLDPATTYRFTVTAIGDGANYADSLESPKGPGTTLTPVVPTPNCGTPRPGQQMPNGSGTLYRSLADGTLGTAPRYDGTRDRLRQPLFDAVPTSTGRGSWTLAHDGGVFAAGDAPFAGSLALHRLNAPVVAIVGTPCGHGYDILGADGGVFSFGDASFHGSMSGTPLNKSMAGIATTCSGNGYYTVATDGGVFTFGDARFHGSMANLALRSPIFDVVPNCSDTGYWLVAADGGVFAYGDVRFYGSIVGRSVTAPIVGLVPTRSTRGYWIIAADGTTYPFGDAHH
ncbi:MAG: hypothetical protein QOJ71_3073 [Actinomycetota bacterium]|nr:hypothetical protein [Actinomycetota bacterium]